MDTRKQLIFDKIVLGIRAQGKPSFDPMAEDDEHPLGVCLYRWNTADGVLKCGAGQIMPDEVYSSKFEGKSVNALPPDVQMAMGLTDSESVALTQDMQQAHDIAAMSDYPFMPEFLDRAEKVAQDHGLNNAAIHRPI